MSFFVIDSICSLLLSLVCLSRCTVCFLPLPLSLSLSSLLPPLSFYPSSPLTFLCLDLVLSPPKFHKYIHLHPPVHLLAIAFPLSCPSLRYWTRASKRDLYQTAR